MHNLSTLLEQNRTNHYKLLVIVDNSRRPGKVINALKEQGWQEYDVNAAVVNLVEGIPENKIKLRIANKIKEWVLSLPDKIVLYNTNVLFSPELGRLNPVGAFKYRSRTREMVVILEGHLSGNKIRYSEIGRDDYTEMDIHELELIDKENLMDNIKKISEHRSSIYLLDHLVNEH